ncbi:MAG TPA: ankyrin repeat domain-containing protein [Tepidisphaeraceae bacterium]|jgi:ankyrin repeat protein
MTQALPAQALPSRPNLRYLKKIAKERLKALRASGATERAQLADAQLQLAREYGFASWKKLKAHVEAVAPASTPVTEELSATLAEFLILATVDPATDSPAASLARAEALLKQQPGVAKSHLAVACVLGDAEAMEDLLKKDAAQPTRSAAPHGWPPLLYVCYSRYLKLRKKSESRFVCAAKLLLDHGADVNSMFVHEGFHETALFGACGIANSEKLTRLLLERGADVDDKTGGGAGAESLYHACEHLDNRCLKLLIKHGASRERLSYCLARKLDFEDSAGAKLMLEAGADPRVMVPTGDPTLMHAIRRGRSVKILQMLLKFGADVSARNKDGMDALRLARRLGRTDVAKFLLKHGAVEDDDPREVFLAACAAGNRRAARTVLEGMPELVKALTPEELKILPDAAAAGKTAAVKLMVELGLDINAKGDWGGSAVHQAAWHGHLALTKFLVARGADLQQKQEFGGDALGTAMHGAVHAPHNQNGPAIVEAVARAMKPVDWARYVKFAEELGDEGVMRALSKVAGNVAAHSRSAEWKPIMDAAFAGDAAAVRRLLEAGADPNVMSGSSHRYRPLHRAIERKKIVKRGEGHEKTVRVLLEAGADPKLRATRGQHTALQLAGMQSPRFVPLLVEKFGELDIFHAAAVGNEQRVLALLERDPTLASARDVNGIQALHYCAASAMYEGDEERETALARIAQRLIDAGADPMATVGQNEEWPLTALYYCCGLHDNPAVAKVLFEAGATCMDNETVFHAADEGHEKCLKLIERYSEAKALAEECTKCLDYQMHFGFTRGAKWLLEHGADANQLGKWGDSAMHSAVRHGVKDATMKLLLEHGGDPAVENREGVDAVRLARKLKRTRLMKLLKSGH